MNAETFFILILIAIIIFLYFSGRNLAKRIDELQSKKQSQSVLYGNLSQQFMPFMKSYPYEPHGFKFLGQPIDGVQFNDDSIVFVEFKINTSNLTDKQKHIKELIEKKQVFFKEIRLTQ